MANNNGLVPAQVAGVLSQLPGLMINVVFGGIMIGKALPSVRRIWSAAAPHTILGTVFSLGQFAIGGLAVTFLLTPVFGLPDAAGSIIEMSFAGGHGTIAGMGGLLEEAGAGELVDVELGSITRSFGAIAIAIGYVILTALRAISHGFESDLFDRFPLFPFTVIGGFAVQVVLSATGYEDLIGRRTVNDITGLFLDVLIAAAIGTLSLATVGRNLASILIFTLLSLAWSVIALLWLGPRVFADQWFNRGIADFGQSQGNGATGFILAEMADPAHVTGAATGYGYKQLFYEPFLGGGILTALSVPIILTVGSLAFGVASAALTVAFIVWGCGAGAPRTSRPVPDARATPDPPPATGRRPARRSRAGHRVGLLA